MKEEYAQFWKHYDKLVVSHIFLVCLPMIVGAVMLAFKYSSSDYLFYGGVEIIILATIDLVLSILWQFWKHKPLPHDLSDASM